ncbi:MAG: hypothetical protein FWF57_03355 [Defluviitaleaceae bacterium]|nr:hypothetical protein [Defluviitaleaceae bacterium]
MLKKVVTLIVLGAFFLLFPQEAMASQQTQNIMHRLIAIQSNVLQQVNNDILELNATQPSVSCCSVPQETHDDIRERNAACGCSAWLGSCRCFWNTPGQGPFCGTSCRLGR